MSANQTNLDTLARVPDHHAVILITGATGCLGAGLVPRLLQERKDATFVLLIRGENLADVLCKRESLLTFADIDPVERERVLVIQGDLTRERLGLTAEYEALLSQRLTEVFHLAADLRFDGTIEESRLLNVDTTKRVIDLVRRSNPNGRFKRFNYVSTAYISGDYRGPFSEEDIDVGQGFFNAYERSKMEAELLVERLKSTIPVTIYRPSIVVGETRTGKIRNFSGLYKFLKLASLGKLTVLPADAAVRLDLVPLDYVADALAFLSRYPEAIGRTFHIAAGLARSEPIRDIIAAIRASAYGAALKMPEVVPCGESEDVLPVGHTRARRNSSLNVILKTYLPYLSFERNFVVDDTAALLAAHGIVIKPVRELLPALCGFALATNFTTDTHPDLQPA
jgi:thioester reductase-like protein